MPCVLSHTLCHTVCVCICVFSHSFVHSRIYLRRNPFSLLLRRLVTILSFELVKESILTQLLRNSVFGAEVKYQFPHALKNIYLTKWLPQKYWFIPKAFKYYRKQVEFYVEAASWQWSRHEFKKNIFTHIIPILFWEKIDFNVVIGLFI